MQNLSPIGWAMRPLKRYAEFSGRSSRAEFWWFWLAIFVVYIVMYFALFGAVFSSLAASRNNPSAGMLGAIGAGGILFCLIWLGLIIPSIAVQVRRLHDTNRSGWWLGTFYLLYAVYFGVIFSSLLPAMVAVQSGSDVSPPDPSGLMMVGAWLLGLGMFIYMIALFVFYCLPGTKGANRYGEDPYGADVEQVFA